MLAGLIMLLTLSLIMGIASFLAGSLPLSVPLSQSQLRMVSTIGMGVLVGTALIVIIPEGVETLYSASGYGTDAHHRRSLSGSQAPNMRNVPILQTRSKDKDLASMNDFTAMPGPVIPAVVGLDDLGGSKAPPLTPTEPGVVGIMSNDGLGGEIPNTDRSKALKDAHSHVKSREPHAWIGFSLVLGFILMYLLDTIPELSSGASSASRSQNNIYSLSDLSSSPTVSQPPSKSFQRSLSTTLGLCIHAAADGIALGASSSSSATKSLSLIIFVAIMVHKAPAAFGLTSVLLKQGLGKRSARAHLFVFSCAAPVGAILTWFVIRALGGGDSEPMVMKWWTGILLLFSGGTFLYVAMHTMHEDEDSSLVMNGSDENGNNGYSDSSRLNGSGNGGRRGSSGDGGSKAREPKLVLAAVAGMLLPLITQIGHAH